jgi:hypothetical protein
LTVVFFAAGFFATGFLSAGGLATAFTRGLVVAGASWDDTDLARFKAG